MAIIDANPLHFTCSKCGARPYEACMDTKGRTIKPHKERVRVFSRTPDPHPPVSTPVHPDNVSENSNHDQPPMIPKD